MIQLCFAPYSYSPNNQNETSLRTWCSTEEVGMTSMRALAGLHCWVGGWQVGSAEAWFVSFRIGLTEPVGN
jgi:hypothetical protein